jgi:hypothetical protein
VSWNLPKLPNLTSAASPRVEISIICKAGQKLGVSLPLLTCSPSAWPSRLLYRKWSEIPEGLMNYPVFLIHEVRCVFRLWSL